LQMANYALSLIARSCGSTCSPQNFVCAATCPGTADLLLQQPHCWVRREAIFAQSRLQIHQICKSTRIENKRGRNPAEKYYSPGCILHLGALFVELVRVARAFAVVCHYSGSHLAAIAARCWAI